MMIRRFLFLLMLVSVSAGSLLAQDDECDPHDVLRRYLVKEEPNERLLRVAAYDHLNAEWTAWSWNGKTLKPLEAPDFELPHTNEPTLIVPRGQGVRVLAINTVPVLYTTKLTASTEADIQGIADLQKIAGLLGSFVTSGVAHVADVRAALVQPSDIQVNAVAAMMEEMPNATRAHRADTAETDLEQLSKDLDAVLDHLLTEARSVVDANKKIKTAGAAAKRQLNAVAAKRDEVAVYLQLAESGSAESFAIAGIAGVDAKLIDAFSQVRTQRDAAAAVPVTCPAVIGLLDKGLVAELDGEPAKAGELLQFQKDWKDVIDGLAEDNLRDCTPELIQPLARIGRWFTKYPPPEDGVGEPLREAFIDARLGISEYLTAVAQRDTLTASATEMLTKRAVAIKQATQLAALAKQQKDVVPDLVCGLRAGVLEVKRVEGRELTLSPTKVRTEEFSITVLPTFSSDLERRRTDVTGRKYNLTRGTWDLDVDTAVVYTDIQDPEYQVSTRQIDIDPDPAPPAAQTKPQYYISERKRETRAGDLALLLTAKPKKARGFGIQLGFGFDTSNPSIFAGLGYAMGDYVKISGGRTWQKVTKLGQKPTGEPYVLAGIVESETDIATREGFDNAWYGALSITIDNLPIFKNE